MSPLNEADTRAKLIDPMLKVAQWGESQIEREHYFVRGKAITDGRIYLIGEESRRRELLRVDYLLRYHGQMVAVLEAKGETPFPVSLFSETGASAFGRQAFTDANSDLYVCTVCDESGYYTRSSWWQAIESARGLSPVSQPWPEYQNLFECCVRSSGKAG